MIRMTQRTLQCVFLLMFILGLATGCATIGKAWKNLVGGGETKEAPRDSGPVLFSEQDNMHPNGDRQYKRMNRKLMEDEAELGAGAGSLWVMEGQGAYLFSQNQARVIGDLLTVKLEGTAKQQLQTKSKVIAKLLERLENPVRAPASVTPGGAAQPAAADSASAGAPAPAAGAAPAVADAAPAKNDTPLTVERVPTRIVEQLKDGSYRVRGVQSFMIGKREYKVTVSGLVRPQDFDEAGIDSSKLLDSQFDIVSAKKGASL
jgi:flagellar L-ring protein precursor FlgH